MFCDVNVLCNYFVNAGLYLFDCQGGQASRLRQSSTVPLPCAEVRKRRGWMNEHTITMPQVDLIQVFIPSQVEGEMKPWKNIEIMYANLC